MRELSCRPKIYRGGKTEGVAASPQGAYASDRLTATAALFTPASPFPKKSLLCKSFLGALSYEPPLCKGRCQARNEPAGRVGKPEVTEGVIVGASRHSLASLHEGGAERSEAEGVSF